MHAEMSEITVINKSSPFPLVILVIVHLVLNLPQHLSLDHLEIHAPPALKTNGICKRS